jgi:hypothetical protein
MEDSSAFSNGKAGDKITLTYDSLINERFLKTVVGVFEDVKV